VSTSHPNVTSRGDTISVERNQTATQHPLARLPLDFITWQREARLDLYQELARSPTMPSFAAHLPTLVTWPGGDGFPNLVVKGAGLIARPEELEGYTRSYQALLDQLATRPWPDTLNERTAAARSFYERPEVVDPHCLCGLEIFEGSTYQNILANPYVSLLFTGAGPRYRSFQLNCVVEIVSAADARFRFIRSMRALFEHESFHYQQPDYPFGYVFWVLQSLDKSLRLRAH